MKILLLSLALATTVGAMAQSPDHAKKTPDQKADARTERMVTELGLNADQAKKAHEINLTFARTMSEVNTLKDDMAREGRAKVVRENRDRDLKAVLTPQQFERMQNLRKEHKVEKDKNDAKDKKDKKDKDEE